MKKRRTKPKGQLDFRTIRLEVGDSFIGEYLFSAPTKTKWGRLKVHYFIEALNFTAGHPKAILGTSDLNFRMRQVAKNAVVKITQVEPKEVCYAGSRARMMKQWDVEYWDGEL